MRWMLGAGALALVGCTTTTLPPLPEVVVVVDTDLPVPLAASRLRIDLFTEEGVWFDSADVARPDPRDWPVSFSVYSDDPSRSRRALVRLRAYLDGHVRDYRGENPFALGGPIAVGEPASDAPRLTRSGRDATPPSEPDPITAVDRLVLLELEPDTKAKAIVVLHGACAGTSALLGTVPSDPVLAEAQTCVDTEKTRAPVALIETKADDGLRGPSAQGSWLAGEPCPADDGGDRVCVPGGATILGATDDVSSSMISARPVRLFGVRRFYLDRHEVTVGRFREAIAAGFHPPYYPVANEGPLGSASTAQQCTWSTQAKDREDYALSCIAWFSARDFCLWAGGALPTELQWEHAATVAGHASKVHYPWGNETPSCDEVAFGGAAQGTGLPECPDAGPLPRPLSASAGDLAPSGAVGLAGGVSEWVLDDAVPYADACWGDAPIVDAHCGDPAKPASWRIARGAFYSGPLTFATTRYKVSSQDQSTFVGFRCAYPEGAP